MPSVEAGRWRCGAAKVLRAWCIGGSTAGWGECEAGRPVRSSLARAVCVMLLLGCAAPECACAVPVSGVTVPFSICCSIQAPSSNTEVDVCEHLDPCKS